MKRRRLTEVVGAVSLLAMLSAPALADTHKAHHLEGFQVVPALSTTGAGKCRVKIIDEATIAVELSYSDLTDVTQAHIHFGQEAVNGGVVLFLCSNIGGPAGTPSCPASPGGVTRTLTAADVIGLAAQGIAAGDLAKVIDAIRADTTYCDVHSTAFPAGEIRGQLTK